MPKSPSSSSHTDDGTETTARKKRNAKGQAAFRAKRSQYIASLEETVQRLETALVQYQDVWRGYQDEVFKLKEDNEKLQQEQREHEELLETLETLYRRGEAPELADLLQSDPSLSPILGDVIKLLPLSTSSSQRSYESHPTYPVNPSSYEGGSGSPTGSISQSPFSHLNSGISNDEHSGSPVAYSGVGYQYLSGQLSEADGRLPESRVMDI